MRAYCVICGLFALGLGFAGDGAEAGEMPPSQLPAARAELSNGFDQTANGWGAYTTAVVALNGPLHADGWRLKLSGGYATYRYDTRDITTCIDIHNGDQAPNRTLAKICEDISGDGPAPSAATLDNLARNGLEIDGNRLAAVKRYAATRYEAAIAPGYQFTMGSVIVRAYAGLGYKLHETVPHDSQKSLAGAYWGARAGLETWVPLADEIWVSADASYFTGTSAHAAAMKLGFRAQSWLSIGPELAAYGNEDDTSGRAGAFLRIDALGFETTVAGGMSGTYKDDTSAYGSASVYMKF